RRDEANSKVAMLRRPRTEDGQNPLDNCQPREGRCQNASKVRGAHRVRTARTARVETATVLRKSAPPSAARHALRGGGVRLRVETLSRAAGSRQRETKASCFS